ncbi:MAG: LysR family transcriptional regulator [Gammaproteobacteria bacterium]|nr:LysR family transcriptional regulator [Gammaproteobacteria bacterium]
MSDRTLRIFYTVARMLSFTKAAEALHMTQPAVTSQVHQLEGQFNTRLFDRTHNRVSLTEAGQCAFEYAEQIFTVYGEMEEAIKGLTGDSSGTLMLGASTTIAEYVMPKLLSDFNMLFPHMRLKLDVSNTEGIVSMIENNQIDLGVVEGPVSNRSLSLEVCHLDQLVVVLRPDHALAQQASIMLKQLMPYPFICREEGSGTLEVILDYLKTQGFTKDDLNIVVELGSPESIKGAVEVGLGLSIVSISTVEKELSLKKLAAIPLNPLLTRSFSFVRQRQKFKQQGMDNLLEFARGFCGKTDAKD